MMSSFWEQSKLNALTQRGRSLLLPVIPLGVGALFSFFQGRPSKLIVTILACFCFVYASKLTRNYFSALANIIQNKSSPVLLRDERKFAMLLVVIGVALISVYIFRRPIMVLVNTAFAAVAYHLHYFGEQLPEHLRAEIPEPIASSHLPPTLKEMIESGENNVAELQKLANKYQHVADNSFGIADKIRTMAQHAHKTIATAVDDPDKIRRLRTFLVVQLPEITQICAECLEAEIETKRLESLDQLLSQANATFIEHNQAIEHSDTLLLDIKMDVLRQQIGSKQYDERD